MSPGTPLVRAALNRARPSARATRSFATRSMTALCGPTPGIPRRHFSTNPKTDKWSDGGPCPPVDQKASGVVCNVARIYDPQLGVIMVMPSGGTMKTFVYDTPARKWRDLTCQQRSNVRPHSRRGPGQGAGGGSRGQVV